MRFSAVILYWLLLIVPSVVLGVFGWRLLRQEERRLDEADQAALRQRAELAVENLALFLEEARAGIVEGLGGIPPFDTAENLQQWARTHPLVRHAFLWRPHAGVIPPDGGSGEDFSAFLNRHGERLAPRGAWRPETVETGTPSHGRAEEKAVESRRDAPPERAALSPRRELQQAAMDARMQNVAALRQRSLEEPAAPAPMARADPSRAPAESPSDFGVGMAVRSEERATSFGDAAAPEFPVAGDSGWSFAAGAEPPVILAWVEMQPGGEVRGAEIPLSEILYRLNALLPMKSLTGERFLLRDPGGNLHPPAFPRDSSAAADAFPVSHLLPGWQLAVFPANAHSPGQGFFLVSSLLLGVLLISILSGGALLLRQSRLHLADARRKSTFVSNVSHELKTPLTSIRLYAEMLAEGQMRDDAPCRHYLEIISQESRRLARLVNNVLDFSRLEQKQHPFRLETFELLPLIREMVANQRTRFDQAGLEVAVSTFSVPDEAPVRADRDATEQILLNLLDNAIKHAAGGKQLEVRVSRGGQTVLVDFDDRGPGIPAAHRHRLFSRFHRVDDILSAPASGFGLGLHISRQLARGQGGDLVHEPRRDGGSRFRLSLASASEFGPSDV